MGYGEDPGMKAGDMRRGHKRPYSCPSPGRYSPAESQRLYLDNLKLWDCLTLVRRRDVSLTCQSAIDFIFSLSNADYLRAFPDALQSFHCRFPGGVVKYGSPEETTSEDQRLREENVRLHASVWVLRDNPNMQTDSTLAAIFSLDDEAFQKKFPFDYESGRVGGLRSNASPTGFSSSLERRARRNRESSQALALRGANGMDESSRRCRSASLKRGQGPRPMTSSPMTSHRRSSSLWGRQNMTHNHTPDGHMVTPDPPLSIKHSVKSGFKRERDITQEPSDGDTDGEEQDDDDSGDDVNWASSRNGITNHTERPCPEVNNHYGRDGKRSRSKVTFAEPLTDPEMVGLPQYDTLHFDGQTKCKPDFTHTSKKHTRNNYLDRVSSPGNKKYNDWSLFGENGRLNNNLSVLEESGFSGQKHDLGFEKLPDRINPKYFSSSIHFDHDGASNMSSNNRSRLKWMSGCNYSSNCSAGFNTNVGVENTCPTVILLNTNTNNGNEESDSSEDLCRDSGSTAMFAANTNESSNPNEARKSPRNKRPIRSTRGAVSESYRAALENLRLWDCFSLMRRCPSHSAVDLVFGLQDHEYLREFPGSNNSMKTKFPGGEAIYSCREEAEEDELRMREENRRLQGALWLVRKNSNITVDDVVQAVFRLKEDDFRMRFPFLYTRPHASMVHGDAHHKPPGKRTVIRKRTASHDGGQGAGGKVVAQRHRTGKKPEPTTTGPKRRSCSAWGRDNFTSNRITPLQLDPPLTITQGMRSRCKAAATLATRVGKLKRRASSVNAALEKPAPKAGGLKYAASQKTGNVNTALETPVNVMTTSGMSSHVKGTLDVTAVLKKDVDEDDRRIPEMTGEYGSIHFHNSVGNTNEIFNLEDSFSAKAFKIIYDRQRVAASSFDDSISTFVEDDVIEKGVKEEALLNNESDSNTRGSTGYAANEIDRNILKGKSPIDEIKIGVNSHESTRVVSSLVLAHKSGNRLHHVFASERIEGPEDSSSSSSDDDKESASKEDGMGDCKIHEHGRSYCEDLPVSTTWISAVNGLSRFSDQLGLETMTSVVQWQRSRSKVTQVEALLDPFYMSSGGHHVAFKRSDAQMDDLSESSHRLGVFRKSTCPIDFRDLTSIGRSYALSLLRHMFQGDSTADAEDKASVCGSTHIQASLSEEYEHYQVTELISAFEEFESQQSDCREMQNNESDCKSYQIQEKYTRNGSIENQNKCILDTSENQNSNNNNGGTFSILDGCIKSDMVLKKTKTPTKKEKKLLAPQHRTLTSRMELMTAARDTQPRDTSKPHPGHTNTPNIRLSTQPKEAFLERPYPVKKYPTTHHFTKRHEFLEKHFGEQVKQTMTTLEPRTALPLTAALPDPYALRAFQTDRLVQAAEADKLSNLSQPQSFPAASFKKVYITRRQKDITRWEKEREPRKVRLSTHMFNSIFMPFAIAAQESEPGIEEETSPIFKNVTRITNIHEEGCLKGVNTGVTCPRGMALITKIPKNQAVEPMRKMLQRKCKLKPYSAHPAYVESLNRCYKQPDMGASKSKLAPGSDRRQSHSEHLMSSRHDIRRASVTAESNGGKSLEVDADYNPGGVLRRYSKASNASKASKQSKKAAGGGPSGAGGEATALGQDRKPLLTFSQKQEEIAKETRRRLPAMSKSQREALFGTPYANQKKRKSSVPLLWSRKSTLF